jgi:hypothetical protein
MDENFELKEYAKEILARGRGADYIDLGPIPEEAFRESPGDHRKHMLVGYRDGEMVEDEPFDEIRLIENVDGEKPLKYKGILRAT